MDAASIFLLVSLVGFLEVNACPTTEDVWPCECFYLHERLHVECTYVRKPEELITPMKVLGRSKLDLWELLINNTSLLDLPNNLLEDISTREVKFLNTKMTSLSESKTDFYGLKNSLELLTAESVEFPSGLNFDQFSNLKDLKEMSFHRCDMQGVIHDLPQLPSLRRVTITASDISSVSDGAFSNLLNLGYLALNDNHITEMKRSMLPNPAKKLEMLYLSNNRLSSLPHDFFDNMEELHYIILKNNQFKYLPEKPFLNGLNRVWMSEFDLSGNPIHCDCSLKWLRKDLRKISRFYGKCSSPEAHYGKSLNKLDIKSFQCK